MSASEAQGGKYSRHSSERLSGNSAMPARKLAPQTGFTSLRKACRAASGGCAGGDEPSVAVIGAGAAGLVATRELRREGLGVECYEAASKVGGIWQYDERAEDDPLGNGERRLHSSLYESLRTNLPREIMSFHDYGFIPAEWSTDTRRFPRHEEVRAYLESFADDFGIADCVSFNRKVVSAELERAGAPLWRVTSQATGHSEQAQEKGHSALVVCNGHYSTPFVPEIPGQETFPGTQIHSHNYRRPESFQGKRIVVLGASASGDDISRELAPVSAVVHVSERGRGEPVEDAHTPKLWRQAPLRELKGSGEVEFDDGTVTRADTILYATGYHYDFPFLPRGLVTVEGGRVSPLFEHCLHTRMGPRLSFIGIPTRVVPFPLMELQSRWVAQMLSRRVAEPSIPAMEEAHRAQEEELEGHGGPVPTRRWHTLGQLQFSYNDRISDRLGEERLHSWRQEMHGIASRERRENPEGYKDDPSIFPQALLERSWESLARSDSRVHHWLSATFGSH